jgi:hypothetical protein
MFAPFPWLWLLGAGVALAVGVIAFMVASGFTEREARGATGGPRREQGHGSNGIPRAS